MSKRWPWVVVAVVLLGTFGANRNLDPRPEVPIAVGALLAAGAVVPALLPLPPAVALIGSGVLVSSYFALGYSDGPVFLALPVVTLVSAWTHRLREWLWPAAVGSALACAALALRTELHDHLDRSSPWQGVGIVATVAAAGAAATALRARQQSTVDRTQRAATEERLRMAQDLHDGVGHGLAVIAMQAGAALHVLDRDPARARENLEAIRATSKESLEALRAELARMSGSPAAARRPAPGLDELDGLLDRVRAGGLVVERTGSPDGVTEATSQAAYAVVQEALTNVLRHARATRATVSFGRGDGGLVVTVRDDGTGGTPTGQDGGMGISGMRSRVEALGGTLEAGPTDRGFRVQAVIPG